MNDLIEKELRSLGVFTLISSRQMDLFKDIISGITNTIKNTGRVRVAMTRKPNAEEERFFKTYFALMDWEIVGTYENFKDGVFMYVEDILDRDNIHGLGISPYCKP